MRMMSRQDTTEQMWETLRSRQPTSAAGPTARPATVCDPWLTTSVHDTLARRRSVRAFTAEPVSLPAVQTIVAAGRDAEAATWPSASHGSAIFEILTVAFNVSGLTTGMYAIRDDRDDALLRVNASGLDSLRIQYADAPVLLLICADLNHACQAAGPAGYASTLVRAGTIGYAAWLRAISDGLAGSVYGGASSRVSHAARQLKPNLWHLFTVAVGHPGRGA